MNAVVSTVKLHLNRRVSTFVIPLANAGVVAAISILIALIAWRSGSEPGSEGWIQGSQSNLGIAYALFGFLGYLGVSSIATTFPFALTLGATRRAFVAGTLIWAAITAAYIAGFLAVFATLTFAGVFAAAWVRWGAFGPQFVAVVVVLAVAIAAIILVPQAAAIAAVFQLWWLAIVAVGVIALSAIGTWLLLRSAIVR